MTRSLAVFPLLLAIAVPVRAQTNATVTDFRLITEMNGRAPDTAIIHAISAGRKYRLEAVGSAPASLFPFGGQMGSVQIMTEADSDITIDYLNSSAKTYFEMKPLEMMRSAKDMMKAMGADMKMTSTADTTVVDSLGDGGLVMGYPTLHFHSYTAHYFTMSMMGESSNMVMRMSSDVYVSPKFKQEWATKDSVAFTPERLTQLMGKMTSAMPMGLDSIISKSLPTMARISRAGAGLKTVTETTNTAMGMTNTTKETMEILKMERTVVPDSMFAIPADYKKTEPAMMMPPGMRRN